MAKKEATLFLKVKDQASKIVKGLRKQFAKFGKDVKKFGKDLRKNFSQRFVITAGDVVNALGAIGRGIVNLALDAAKFQEVEKSFTELARAQGKDADEMLDNMEKLSEGTISRMELMKKANTALLLGLPVERFGDMLTIARSSAKATGESMEFMLNSIVTGLGRGSKLMLDNLGIVFKLEDSYDEFAASIGKTAAQLSEAEKKQAFLNKALEVGLQNVKNAGPTSLTLVDLMAQLKANTENFAITLGEKLGPALKTIVFGFSETIKAAEGLFSGEVKKKSIPEFNAEIEKLDNKIKDIKKTSGGAQDLFRTLLGRQGRLKEARQDLGELLNLKSQAVKEEKRQADVAAAKAERDRIAEEEARLESAVRKQEQLVADGQTEIDIIGLNEEGITDILLKETNKRLALATKNADKLRLLKEKEALLDQKRKDKQKEVRDKEDKEILAARGRFLSKISSLQSSSNSALAALGKAAAIAQITISTGQAAMDGFKWGMAFGGPVLASVFQGLAIAAGAAQIARVSGVALAEGGIVPATPGGISATIGEGGRSEAVIPLPDDFDPDEPGGAGGTTVNITVNGGMLGDSESAREFAIAVDSALLDLKRGNESTAFDEDII